MRQLAEAFNVFGLSLILSSVGHTAILKISCEGDASAALSASATDSTVLNPYYYPFLTDLNENQPFYIGRLEGGCGSFGCPSFFRANYRIFFDGNKMFKEVLDELEDGPVEIPPGVYDFSVSRYGYTKLVLQCRLNIEE